MNTANPRNPAVMTKGRRRSRSPQEVDMLAEPPIIKRIAAFATPCDWRGL
jgi:hypothetical protein